MADALPDRVKGQETTVLITTDGNLEDSLVDVVDFTVTNMLEIISKGYLGEKTERKDEIFKGVKFDITFHVHTQDVLNFTDRIKKRAMRLTPNTKFNITSVLQFPNGDTPSITINDAKFGEAPMSTRSREDYVEFKYTGESSDYSLDLS